MTSKDKFPGQKLLCSGNKLDLIGKFYTPPVEELELNSANYRLFVIFISLIFPNQSND